MNLFWLEYLHFIVSIFAILVCVSSATLFLLTYRSERKLTTVWRAIGFSSLAIAFFLYILERKFGAVGLIAMVVELFGLFGIYQGMSADLSLAKLAKAPVITEKAPVAKKKGAKKRDQKAIVRLLIAVLVFAAVFFATYFLFPDYTGSVVMAFTIIFIVATIRLQVIRLKNESVDKTTRKLNTWPLVGYVFLLYRAIALVLYRLPDLNIVILREVKLNYSLAWQLAIAFAFLGFLFLALWAWTFIRVRKFLRTYVTFLAIAILVSSLGSLVFTQLIFKIVETNNLDLMLRGSETEEIIASDKQDTALFIARTIATNPTIVKQVQTGNTTGLTQYTEEQQQGASLDILRIYNTYGEVLASPGDDRERGDVFNDDPLVSFAIMQRSHIKSFDVQEGVLTPVVVARAVHPILVDGTVIGAVEAGYILDNAFVDYSKEKTGLDVTVYSNDTRSATTIHTLDGVSRWVGSKESVQEIVTTVLTNGETYAAVVDRLGIQYYSAYVPIRDINGQVIGMISVGTPTVILFENTRQQLVTTFLIVTVISLLAAGLGYVAIKSFRKVKAA